jgi:methionyl-tRNA formyltransferase
MSGKKIVMCGCHELGYYLVASLLEKGITFDYFVSLTPEQSLKNNISGYKDFLPIAEKHKISIYYCKKYSLKDPEDIGFFKEHKFDLLIQGGWQRLFPNEVLETLTIGAVGVHGSSDYLPKGRGRSPLNWSLIEGKKRFIMQLFLIQAGIDDGPIFDSEIFDINEFDNIRTLYYKNKIVTERMLLRSVPKLIDGDIQFFTQKGIPSYYNKRTEEDGKIDWENMDVWQIYNFVRAQTRPYPGAFGVIDNKYYKIWHAQIFDTRITYKDSGYGVVVERFDKMLIINCKGGLLLVDDYEEITVKNSL